MPALFRANDIFLKLFNIRAYVFSCPEKYLSNKNKFIKIGAVVPEMIATTDLTYHQMLSYMPCSMLLSGCYSSV